MATVLSSIEGKPAKLPDTVMAITGNGRFHYLFEHPGNQIRNRTGTLGAGLPEAYESFAWQRSLPRPGCQAYRL